MCFWKNGIGAEIDPPSPPSLFRVKNYILEKAFPKLINNLLEEFDEPAVRLRSCNTGIKGNTGSTVLATEKTPISSNSCWSCISWLQNVNKYSLSNKKSVPTNSPATNSLSTNKC